MNEDRDAALEAAAEVQELLRIADLLWEEAHGAPPLEDDPVAAMLGLVPDASRSLDPRALNKVTKSSGD